MCKKISLKITVGVICVLLLISVAFVPLYVSIQEDKYIETRINDMNNSFELLHKFSLSAKKSEIKKYVDEMNMGNYRITIYNSDFNELYRSGVSKYLKGGATYKFPANKYSENAEPIVIEKDGQACQICLRKIVVQDNKVYYIQIVEDIRAIYSVMSYTNRTMIYVLLVYMVICAVATTAFINVWVNRIKQLSNVAEKVTSKDYSVRYIGKITNDEIGILAKNLNLMIDTMQENITSLNNYNFLLKEDLNYLTEYENTRKIVLSNITHELKTPLAIISSQVEMINCTTDAKKRDFYCKSVIEEVDKISIMVTSLLEYSVTAHEIYKGELERVNIGAVIDNLCRKNSSPIEMKKIKLKTNIECNSLINIEKNHIEHVFNNYFSNAIRHTKENGLIRISLKEIKNKIRLSVFNQGTKIDDINKEKIWTDFFTTKENPKNLDGVRTGLGLFIVKEIATIDHTDCGFINYDDGVEFWFDFINKV